MSIKLSGGARRQPSSSVAAGFERALAEHQAGHKAAAEAGYRAVLRQAPRHRGALQNLGAICRAEGRHHEAMILYRRALAQDPDADDVRLNLGNLLNDMGRHAEAETVFREVLLRRPNDARTLYGLSVALVRQQSDTAAVEILERLVTLDPEHRRALRSLAVTLVRLGQEKPSLAAYERLLALEPDDASVRHLVDALRGNASARAPAAYVKMVFDSHAASFEASLKGKPAYRMPELLTGMLAAHVRPGDRFAHAVDLGCGTGLMAPLLRSFCERLEGVDLSSAMIGEAEKKGLYDALAAADIIECLHGETTPLDLITAADVFVYLGDLTPVFAAAAARLRPGGLFLFSTEHLSPGEDFRLQPTARFAHGEVYLERLAQQHGFAILSRATTTIRRERGAGVVGGLYLLRRESDPAIADDLARAQELHRTGRLDAAAALYAEILERAPDHPLALDRLAAIHARQGRAEAARALYRRALELVPNNPVLHLGLGQTLNQLHAFADAVPCLRRAVELAPDAAAPRIGLAFALLYSGAATEARAAAAEATRLDPSNAAAQYVLAKILALGGDPAAAEEALGKARALGLDPGGIGDLEHLIHGRSEGTTALATLRDKYDQTALYYESHVLAGLQNRTRGLLLDLLDRHVDPTTRFAAGLELGCGPGVTGEALRRRVDRLVGVDLSPAMIAQAERRRIYDRLLAADLMTFLGDPTETETFGLIFASDVLPHIATFGPLLAVVAERLQPGGLFLFSTEHSEAADRVPLPEFRFRHSLGHVAGAAAAAGLAMLAHEVKPIRVERGAPVQGGLYLLWKVESRNA
jgi:predicted TPR repeat methyltransferase